MAALLKKAFENTDASMEDILNDEDACTSFFGSTEVAAKYFEGYTQVHWEILGTGF